MDHEVITTGTVEGGEVHMRNKAEWLAGVRSFKGEVEFIARRKHATRSDQQNRYYWGVVVAALHDRLKEDGWTEDDVHEFLKQTFVPKRLAITDSNGEVKDGIVIGATTTRLNKLQFSDYCKSIIEWAAQELDIVIPDPEGGLT